MAQLKYWNGSAWVNAVVGVQGPVGPVGATNVVYTQQGTLSVITGLTRFYFDSPKTISKIRASVGTAPTGSAIIVRLFKNGISVADTTINANSFTGTSTPFISVVSDDYVTISVTQVGAMIAGSDLTVSLTLEN
jgi:hypothetical protein